MTDKDSLKTLENILDSIKSFSVKLDNLSAIVMSISNEMARLDERVTHALKEQDKQSKIQEKQNKELQSISERVTKLENSNQNVGRFNQLIVNIFLIILSASLTAFFMK